MLDASDHLAAGGAAKAIHWVHTSGARVRWISSLGMHEQEFLMSVNLITPPSGK